VTPQPPGAPVPDTPEAAEVSTREELLRVLDRESAIARATDGRLAVLILELRRVDRLQALLRGPAPATTMELVLDRLRKALRPEDRMAAIGEEQLCIVLPRLAHPSQAVLAAVKLLRALDRPIAHEGGTAVLRPCVGIALLPEHGYDPAELLMAADISRQIAATREEGYHIATSDDVVETEVYRGLDLDLERAIRANELEMHYQPQLDIMTGRPVGVEALLRWHHFQAGDVPPQTIVGIAERTGLIGSLTFWIMNAVLRQAQQWSNSGLEARIALNLSISTLTDRELPAVVDQSLKTWGVEPATLVIELAENAMIADAERSGAMLTRLKGVGVQLSIDDFGTGFTSLAQMRRFPIDEIKIDRPYVAGMLESKADAALVKSAIDIAHNFGLRCVAEGVESPLVLAELQRLGCDCAQGYLFGKAMADAPLRHWWAERP
jgi:predicted signal transduction protein with EAL and GGDEF domain